MSVMVSGSTVRRRPGSVGRPGGNSRIAPRTIAAIPPAVRMPWLGTHISATNRTTAKTMRAIPAPFASSVPMAKSARRIAMTPTTPGKMRLGFESSKMSPYVPTVKSRSATCGSVMKWRIPSSGLNGWLSLDVAAVARVTGPSGSRTSRPLAARSSSGTLEAIRSTMRSSSASSAVMLTLSRTALSAQSAFLPRAVAMLRIWATASFSTFVRRSPSISSPDEDTGCAAPMFVAGAIAATCPAIVMNVPAEAAREPEGETYVITGTRAVSIRLVIRLVESRSPPGVLMVNTTAATPRSSPSRTRRST